MKLFFLLIPFIAGVNSVLAQDEDILLQFDLAQIENHIQLNFTIKAGNTCSGIVIYHATDSANFSEIGNIQGICGSSDRNESYSFIDYSPAKNARNYYRLQLGTLGNSKIGGLFFVDLSGNNTLVFPNPVTDESAICFLNAAHEELLMTISGYDSKLVYKGMPSRGSSFPLSSKDFIPGMYFFKIESSGRTLYKGKFVIR